MATSEHTEASAPKTFDQAYAALNEALRARSILAIYRHSLQDDEHADDIYLLDAVIGVLDKAVRLADGPGGELAQDVQPAAEATAPPQRKSIEKRLGVLSDRLWEARGVVGAARESVVNTGGAGECSDADNSLNLAYRELEQIIAGIVEIQEEERALEAQVTRS